MSPVPADWVNESAASELEKVTSKAETIVMSPRSMVAPTAPVKVTLPVPAVIARSSAKSVVPLSVLLKRTFPMPAPVLKATACESVRVTARVKTSVDFSGHEQLLLVEMPSHSELDFFPSPGALAEPITFFHSQADLFLRCG